MKSTLSAINATVEILVWTDFSFYQSFQKLQTNDNNVEEAILRYVATLLNAVSIK